MLAGPVRLWVVSLAAHFALDYLIDPHSPNGGLGAASILLYVAVTYTLQRLLAQTLARRLPVSDRRPESLTGSRS